MKLFSDLSAKTKIVHRHSLPNQSFVRCNLYLPEHRQCDASPAAHPFRGRARPICYKAISVFRLRYRSTLFFLSFCLQHTAEVLNLLVECTFFFHCDIYLECYYKILSQLPQSSRDNKFSILVLHPLMVIDCQSKNQKEEIKCSKSFLLP